MCCERCEEEERREMIQKSLKSNNSEQPKIEENNRVLSKEEIDKELERMNNETVEQWRQIVIRHIVQLNGSIKSIERFNSGLSKIFLDVYSKIKDLDMHKNKEDAVKQLSLMRDYAILQETECRVILTTIVLLLEKLHGYS
jgi:hypothetical protein